MRQFIFRAWHKELEDMSFSSNDLKGFWAKLNNYPDQYEVMQYTGLKDKNGVEIYEGDILKGARGATFVCRFRDETGCFEFESTFSTDFYLFGTIYNLEPIIIGNKYQNSELLTNHLNPKS